MKKRTGAACFNIGLSDRSGAATISMPSFSQNARVKKMPGNTGLLSLYGESLDGQTERVSLTTIDSWQNEERQSVDNCFIKIDAEGHEYAILKGARKALGGNNTFQIEFNPVALKMANVEAEDIFDLMRSHCFCSYVFEDGMLKPFTGKDFASNERVVDVLFVKG